MYAKAREAMDRQGIKPYLDAVWTVVADANRYFAGEEPWAKRKTDFKRMETILYVTAEVVRQVAILAQPATPDGSGKLLDGLGQAAEARSLRPWARPEGSSPASSSRHRPARFRAMWIRRRKPHPTRSPRSSKPEQ